MMNRENNLYIAFPAHPENERISRMIAAAFLTEMNPTLEEIDDVKTAVSEAVTNCIIHAYEKELSGENKVEMYLKRQEDQITVIIEDRGKGIENVSLAMEPLFTTKKMEERSGMGFSFMEAFMDQVEVESVVGKGTKVTMRKKIGINGQQQRKI